CPSNVSTAIETIAIRKSRSAYSTIACPSSRSRADWSARYTRIGSARTMSTIVLLLGAAFTGLAHPAEPSALRLAAARAATSVGHVLRCKGRRSLVLLLEGWVRPTIRTGASPAAPKAPADVDRSFGVPRGLQVGDDLVEERRHAMPQQCEHSNRDDCDQKEQERVFHHRLPLLARARVLDRHPRPHRERTDRVDHGLT